MNAAKKIQIATASASAVFALDSFWIRWLVAAIIAAIHKTAQQERASGNNAKLMLYTFAGVEMDL